MELVRDKRVGKVLLIVEGARHEFHLAKKIFVDILGYSQIEKKRDNASYYVRKGDMHSIVAVVNTRTSNISSINEDEYLDIIFEKLIEEYDFDINNAAIYYLFDRDPESNANASLIKDLIKKLKNSRENEEGMRGGMLLLSYPAIESYEISNFVDDSYKMRARLGKELKAYINDHAKIISMNKMNEKSVIHAGLEMVRFLQEQNIIIDLDDFANTNEAVFVNEERNLQEDNAFGLLSLFSSMLMDLGILKE